MVKKANFLNRNSTKRFSHSISKNHDLRREWFVKKLTVSHLLNCWLSNISDQVHFFHLLRRWDDSFSQFRSWSMINVKLDPNEILLQKRKRKIHRKLKLERTHHLPSHDHNHSDHFVEFRNRLILSQTNIYTSESRFLWINRAKMWIQE